MRAIKNIAFMGASTVVRLGFGMLTFVVLARFLGPTSFGVLMLWLSVSTLLSMLANYGFTPYLLREVGARPESVNLVMSEVFASKILVSIALIVIISCALPFFEQQARWVFFLLLLAMLADSTSDFLNVGYRVTNRYSEETRIATLASISQFSMVVVSVYYSNDVVLVAFAFLVSRFFVLGMTWFSQRQYFSKLRPARFDRAIFRLRHGISYAFDFGLQSMIGQLDSLILNYFLGPVAVGVHQAGMRLFLGGTQIANILGNVFIPRVAGILGQQDEFQREAQYLQSAFLGAGAIFGLVLAVAATPIVNILFGKDFVALVPLLPWFGLLFFIRFFAAAYGVLLTAAGMQSLRAKANFFHWFVILIAAWILVPRFGNVGWILALAAGNLLLGCIYYLATRNIVRISMINLSIIFLAVAGFSPFLSIN